jgi:DNA-binding transcriptional LysR family regulator
MIMQHPARTELWAILRLSGPLIASQLAHMLMVAEDVAQGRLSLPWPTAVASGESYYLVWPKTRPGGERLRRLAEFLQAEVKAMALPSVERLD